MSSGIYQIKNIVNGKRYIGQAFDVRVRWNNHKSTLFRGVHSNTHLQNSYNKYGIDSFKFTVLEYVGCSDSIDDLKEKLKVREQYYMDKYDWDSLYNMCPSAGSPLGKKVSEETKLKLSKAHTGKRLTLEHRNKISLIHRGKKVSVSTRNKIAKSKKGKKRSPEVRAKISKSKKGKKVSRETKKKLSILKCGDKNPFYGKTHTEETKSKMSLAHKGKSHSEETKRKMSLDRKGAINKSSRIIVFKGETRTAAEWSCITGIKYRTLIGRLNSPHWSVERALTTKLDNGHNK